MAEPRDTLTRVASAVTEAPDDSGVDMWLAWSPDGSFLAGPSNADIVIWNQQLVVVERLKDVDRCSWAPDSWRLAILDQFSEHARLWIHDLRDKSASIDLSHALPEGGTHNVIAWHPIRDELAVVTTFLEHPGALAVAVWDIATGEQVVLEIGDGHTGEDFIDDARCAAWSTDGTRLAFNMPDGCVGLLTKDGMKRAANTRTFILDIAWDPSDQHIAATTLDSQIFLLSTETGLSHTVLELPDARIVGSSFSADGQTLVSMDGRGGLRGWATDSLEETFFHPPGEPTLKDEGAVAFHPSKNRLATIDADYTTTVWDVDLTAVEPDHEPTTTTRYRNATVLLVGDSGVGKSGLALALAGLPFAATESTHGRFVHMMHRDDQDDEIREIFLWDLAGQPGYRLIHQLHLGQADVALVLIDARPEGDPLAGARYWSRALLQASQGRATTYDTRWLLVAARTDRGTVSLPQAHIEAVTESLRFDRYLTTSARTGDGVAELREAILAAIDWSRLPQVVSSKLFLDVKAFLVTEKESGRVLMQPDELMRRYREQAQDAGGPDLPDGDELRQAFDLCIGRIEKQALIQRLRFGGLVLLQPELLDTLAALIVNAARAEKQGLGTIAEEEIYRLDLDSELDGALGSDQEHLLLIATVEELLRREIALREQTDAGPQLVFPSELTRDSPETPDLPGVSVRYVFDGAVGDVYATLVVRLSRSGLFVLKDIWRTAVMFTSKTGSDCGIAIRASEGHAELDVVFDADASPETRFQFDDYIGRHLGKRAVSDSVVRTRVHVCCVCGESFSPGQVDKRLARGFDSLRCPVCETLVSLTDWRDVDDIGRSRVAVMNRAADAERDREANKVVVAGKAASGEYDVFLCHHSADKPAVIATAEALKARGLRPWLDTWELQPGRSWIQQLEASIENVRSAAVFVGPSGEGPWQRSEIDALLQLFVERDLPVIPVLIDDAREPLQVPLFLRSLQWVRMAPATADGLERLIWGITGVRPDEQRRQKSSGPLSW